MIKIDKLKTNKSFSKKEFTSESVVENSKDSLKTEGISVKKAESKNFLCPFENCLKTFRTNHRLKIHIQSHVRINLNFFQLEQN
jgi:uncharacterized Zn-finger protein